VSSGAPPVPPKRTFTPPTAGEVILHGENQYILGAEIGGGFFGKVYECTDEWGNDLVAKVLLPRDRSYDAVRKDWLAEMEKLVQLRHPNITFVHAAFEYRDTFYLVIERCTRDLEHLINMPGLKGDVWIPHLARDVLQAIGFIHAWNYVHKDIHPKNVFMAFHYDRMVPSQDPTLSFKVGDLGISRLESDINVFNTALAQWMLPPEFLDPPQFGAIGRPVDIYHAGLLLLSLSLGSIPAFSRDDILAGRPRETAEQLNSPYSKSIARALRRHVSERIPTAMAFWREIRGT
jgi:serine/threonine protein kinase